MAAGYRPVYPVDVQVGDSVKEFVTRFYGVSDTPGKDAEWVDFFRDDATLVMAKDKAAGKTEIRRVRDGMWTKVAARKHTVSQAFPARFAEQRTATGSNGEEEEVQLMLFGSVVYRLKGAEGDEEPVEWAGHARLVRASGEEKWRFAHYRVWIQR